MFRRTFLNCSIVNCFFSNVETIFKCWSNTEKAIAVIDSYSSMYVEASGRAISNGLCFGRYTLSFACKGVILGAKDRRKAFAHGTRPTSHV